MCVCLEALEGLDMSPGDYLSSDGGSGFQLMKTDGDTEKPREGREGREGKKRSRKYRGATEEILAGWVMGVCVCTVWGGSNMYIHQC